MKKEYLKPIVEQYLASFASIIAASQPDGSEQKDPVTDGGAAREDIGQDESSENIWQNW